MKRILVLASVAAATLLAATAAEAGGVHWSVGINLPPAATYVSGGPAYYPNGYPSYYPAPVYQPRRYVAPQPVYVEPAYAPVYEVPAYRPRIVYREPQRAYYGPAPYYAPRPHAWLPPLPPLPRLPPLPPLPWSHHGDHVDDRR